MRSTKNKMIIIIASIIVITIIALVILIAVLHKKAESNQDDLWEYVFSENTKTVLKNFLSGEDYNEGLKNKKYESTSTITFEGNINNNDKVSDYLRNIEVKDTKKVNNETNQAMGNTTINYLNNEIFKVDYIKDNQSYGIKSDEVIDRYLGIRIQNLDLLAQKVGYSDYLNFLQKLSSIDYTDIIPNEDTIDLVRNDIKKALSNQISPDKFTKQTKRKIELDGNEITTDSYTIVLDDEQVANISKAILEEVLNDSQLITDINEKLQLLGSQTIDEETIQKILSSSDEYINGPFTHEQKIMATIYILDKKMVKLDININQNSGSEQLILEVIEASNKIKLTINEQKNDSNNSTEIQLNKNEADLCTLSISNNDLGSVIIKSKTVEGSLKENHIINKVEVEAKSENNNITAVITNTINIVENIEIENLSSNNCAFINEMSAEEIKILYSAIQERIKSLYNEKIKLIDSGELQGKIKPANEDVTKHNQQFEMYEGEFAGTIVVELLNKVIQSNNTSEYLIQIETKLTENDNTILEGKDVTVENVQPLANLLSGEELYNITFDYHPVSGAINNIKIVKKSLTLEENTQVVLQNEQQ